MYNLRTHEKGWTRCPEIAAILQQAAERFVAVYPWSTPRWYFNPEHDLRYVLLTAAEVSALQPHIPTSMHPEEGHNDGPSWEECAILATACPDMLFAGFLMPPARADEGVDLDAVYVPQPDPDHVWRTRAITRPDGTVHGPDEDGEEEIDGRSYRRLWWD